MPINLPILSLENHHQNNKGKQLIFSFGLIICLAIIASTVYVVSAMLGMAPLNWSIFFGIVWSLVLLHLILLVIFWKNNTSLSVTQNIFFILWVAVAIWFWLFAPIYYFFTINIDLIQLRWVAFSFIWEVPLVGGQFILICLLLFRPVQQYLDGKSEVNDPQKLYKFILQYPLRVGVLIVVFTILGYIFGVIQLLLFASLAAIEQFKTIISGGVVAIFLGTFYYIFLDTILDGVRAKIENDFKLTNVIQRKIYHKVIGISLAIVLGCMGLIGLSSLQSLQTMISQGAVQKIKSDTAIIRFQLNNNYSEDATLAFLQQFKSGESKEVYLYNTDQSIQSTEFSDQTNSLITKNSEGVIEDFKTYSKVISFFNAPTLNKKVVLVVYLKDYYGPLATGAQVFIAISLLIILLTIGIITISSMLLTRSISLLSSAVRKAEKEDAPFTFHINTADELEELSHAFTHFIHQSKSAVENLKEANSRTEYERAQLQTLVESLPIGVILTKAPDGEIVVANSVGISMIGRHLSLGVKKDGYGSIFDMVNEDDSPFPVERLPITTTLTEGIQAKKSDIFIRKSDGHKIPIQIISTPVNDEEGNMIGVVTIFEDITQQYVIDRAKNEFVYLASHQLRTPLTTIKWYTEMLLSKDVGVINDKQMKYLNEVYKGNQRMINLVNDLLNVSRIELNTFKTHPEQVDIKQIAQNVIEDLYPLIKSKELAIKQEFNLENSTYFLDPQVVRIVLQNLLTNALKYTPQGGSISLLVEEQKTEQHNLFIKVTDNGIGIPDQQKYKIFTKFFRADNIAAQDSSGTGLGLYVIKSLVYQAGGRVWFDSEVNKGTTFYVTLPIAGKK